jgi:hypothetical protein
LGSTSARFRSTAACEPFLQPLDLHVQPADLLEVLGLAGLALLALAAAAVAEEGLAPRDGTMTFDQFDIPSGPVSGVHYKAPLHFGVTD